MTKPRSFFHYLLIGFFMLSMLMPAVHADSEMPMTQNMSEQSHDCHTNAESEPQHDASSHCASGNCQCAAANCHVSGVLGFQPVFTASLYSQSRLSIAAEQFVSQHPTQFERPPRS